MWQRTSLYVGVWEEQFLQGIGSCGPQASDLSTALDVSLWRPICFRVRALILSHALLLFHSPIFGLLFLYQPLSG